MNSQTPGARVLLIEDDQPLAAAVANRSNLTALVRSEVDAAMMTRLGLVPLQRLPDVRAVLGDEHPGHRRVTV